MGRGQKTCQIWYLYNLIPFSPSMKWRGGLKGERVKEFLFYGRSFFIHQSGEEPKKKKPPRERIRSENK